MDYGNFVGFETIGNATLIAYDNKPILVTDPWLSGHAFFGSFGNSHEIPEAQRKSIFESPFVWLSHGHPDHIDALVLEKLHGKQILLPDHVGNRIRDELIEQGFRVQVLKNCEWVGLSKRVRVLCLSDYFQDAVLLIDINGRLVININDAADRAWGGAVKKIVCKYDKSYLLKFFGTGVGDMANFFDEFGKRVVPPSVKKKPLGRQIEFYTQLYGATDTIPFSSFHTYQRRDSCWANEYRSTIDELYDGFTDTKYKLHKPFARVNCSDDNLENIRPQQLERTPLDPIEFGDDWSQHLDSNDNKKIARYFHAIESLVDHISFINFVVGGKTTTIELSKKRFKRGITFETPRASLINAIENEVFDDLLIGNFTKTILHGDWDLPSLHPYFTPYVARYSDNGRAKSKKEVAAYFEIYKARAPFAFMLHRFERESERRIRKFVGANTAALQIPKKLYLFLKRA